MFLSGAQISGILGSSEHLLFVDGPDVHAEVVPAEMQRDGADRADDGRDAAAGIRPQ